MAPSSCIAILCFAMATGLAHWSLARRRSWTGRKLDAATIMALSIYGLSHAPALKPYYAVEGTYQITMIWLIPYTVRRLLLEYPPVNKCGLPVPRWSIYQAYKVWCNPRDIGDPYTYDHWRREPSSKVLHLTRMVLLIITRLTITSIIIPPLADAFIGPFYASDFGADRIYPRWSHITALDIAKRAYVVFDWFWYSYNSLTIFHHTLSIVHVCILRLDEPEEWPPLFGHWLEANSLRGFWGACWHSLLSPTYVALARHLATGILDLPPGSRMEKVFAVACVYTAAAIVHSIVSWLDDDPTPWTFAAYYAVQFLGTAVEASVMGTRKKKKEEEEDHRRSGSGLLPVLARKAAGMLWVALWLLVTTPPLLYSQMTLW